MQSSLHDFLSFNSRYVLTSPCIHQEPSEFSFCTIFHVCKVKVKRLEKRKLQRRRRQRQQRRIQVWNSITLFIWIIEDATHHPTTTTTTTRMAMTMATPASFDTKSNYTLECMHSLFVRIVRIIYLYRWFCAANLPNSQPSFSLSPSLPLALFACVHTARSILVVLCV